MSLNRPNTRLRHLSGLLGSLGLLGFACLQSAGQTHAKPAKALAPSLAHDVKPLITKYCVTCHSGNQPAAGLNLTKLLASTDFSSNLETWGKVSSRIGSGMMPPSDQPQPKDAEKLRVTTWIENKANELCKLATPARVTIRRLNRAEYNNTIHDLTGLDVHPAEDFPSDDVGYGFDDIGDVLSISPLLMEKYLSASEAVLNAAMPLPSRTLHVDSHSMTKDQGVQDDPEGWRSYASNAECFKEVDITEAGSYQFKALAGGDLAGSDPPHMDISVDGAHVTQFNVGVSRRRPKVYECPVTLSLGKHKIGVAFTNDYYNTSEPKGRQDRNLWLNYFELEPISVEPGPPSPAEIRLVPFQPPPDQESKDARLFITKFALKAYRRPPTNDELDRLMKIYALGRQGTSFNSGIKLAMEAVLSSPNFLFRVELDPRNASGTVRPLNDYELASRLSYFLWSSMPDDELFGLAKDGTLHNPKVLQAQVERMIADPKASALADNFAGQWLQLRKLAIVDPDPKRFPGIDDTMKRDMATETKMFFMSVLRDNRPISDFIDGKYSYVNGRLAALYGLTGVTDDQFHRVTLTGARGGVLTQASVLLVTSNPTRTSPTKRGKWVLEQILGTPPPPPPPGVGVINDETKRIEGASLRQLMEEHRKNPMCAACHAKMDPIGFGLENFDAVGRWRTMDGTFPLDTKGTLPGGVSFNGPSELKKILLKDKKAFGRALTEKLLTYGLGRGVEPSDKCAIDDIVKLAASQNYKFASLIKDVVLSDPFCKRSTQIQK